MIALDWLHSYAARWHDAWEIAGAIGTVAAVGTALGLGYLEVRSSNERHRQDAKRLEDERDLAQRAQRRAETNARSEAIRRQALAVPLWPTDRLTPTKVDDYTGEVLETTSDRFWTVENFSDAPVFSVVIRFYAANGDLRGDIRPRSVLKPGQAHVELEPDDAVPWKTAVLFRDVRSVQWRRTMDDLEIIDTY